MKTRITLTMKSNMLAEVCLPPSAVSLVERQLHKQSKEAIGKVN